MNDFHHLGKTVALSEIRGIVTGEKKWAETKIEARGGADGSAANISSTVAVRQEFWIRTDAGRDYPVQLSGVDIPISRGQQLGLVSAESPGIEGPVLVQIVNYNAKSSGLINASVRRVSVEFHNWNATQKRIVGAALMAALIAAIAFPLGWIFVAGWTLWFVYRVFRWYGYVDRTSTEFERHLRSEASRALESEARGRLGPA